MGRLRTTSDEALTLRRRKWGRGFQYLDENDRKITDKALLKRLKSLVIPPMWTEVQICKWDDGHIQAIGRDQKGRKQYIYHSQWERQQQAEKFARVVTFGKALPALRKRCLKDIESAGWSREKVLALMLLLLDETGIRIGNHHYSRENQTYGLSTLRRKHLSVDSGELKFQYTGKSNKEREVTIDDRQLIDFIKAVAEQPGYQIFRYFEEGGWHDVDSDDVNQRIKELTGGEFYSKDFRTWAASRLAVEYYPQALAVKRDAPRKKFTNILIRMVAEELGNTPTVCRDYYVHPEIMRRIDAQDLPSLSDYRDSTVADGHSASEKLLLSVLE